MNTTQDPHSHSPDTGICLPFDLSQPLSVLWCPPLKASGVVQMALDEALLDWLRLDETAPKSALVCRVYEWSEPTVSVGKHQALRSIAQALEALNQSGQRAYELVRRPTGGRALLHDCQADGECSFAVVTNHPQLCSASLADSYCWITTVLKVALAQLGRGEEMFAPSCTASSRAYAAAPLCMDTQTPWDLMTPAGQKFLGSAQCRRKGGVLQHGSIKQSVLGADRLVSGMDALHQAMLSVLARQAGGKVAVDALELPDISALAARVEALEAVRHQEVQQMWARLSTTAGSHLVPASLRSTS
ncbi:MAG: hypothetical protein R2857_02265 [Vampirovibrionales bacterium]